MIKRLTAVFAVLIIVVLTACKANENAPMVSMYDLRVEMLSADGAMPKMLSVSSADNQAKELFTYLSDFDYEKVEGYFLSYADDGMAFEIAVVCLKDGSDMPALKKSLEEHVHKRVELYKTYAPDQVPLAEETLITSSGRYAAFIMCRDQNSVRAAFEKGVN